MIAPCRVFLQFDRDQHSEPFDWRHSTKLQASMQCQGPHLWGGKHWMWRDHLLRSPLAAGETPRATYQSGNTAFSTSCGDSGRQVYPSMHKHMHACKRVCMSANDVPPAASCHFGWGSATGPALTRPIGTNGVSHQCLCQSGSPRGSQRMSSNGCAMLCLLPNLTEPAVQVECTTLAIHKE